MYRVVSVIDATVAGDRQFKGAKGGEVGVSIEPGPLPHILMYLAAYVGMELWLHARTLTHTGLGLGIVWYEYDRKRAKAVSSKLCHEAENLRSHLDLRSETHPQTYLHLSPFLNTRVLSQSTF